MKTLLIPVDLTVTSDNTINFSIKWANEYGYNHIVLLKTLYSSMFEMLIPSADYVNSDYMHKEREEAREQLNRISQQLKTQVAEHIKVSTIISELPLLRSILEVTEETKPALIIIGSNNQDYSGDSFIANNVISIAKASPVRVLIVPSHYQYKPIHKVLVPCDFNWLNHLTNLSKTDHIDSINWSNKELLVLNIDPKEKYLSQDEQFKNAEKQLHEYLQQFHHSLYYSNNKNIINGITDFYKTHEVELIVALPGKHSFLYSLTHKSISEAICHNATKPVLILK